MSDCLRRINDTQDGWQRQPDRRQLRRKFFTVGTSIVLSACFLTGCAGQPMIGGRQSQNLEVLNNRGDVPVVKAGIPVLDSIGEFVGGIFSGIFPGHPEENSDDSTDEAGDQQESQAEGGSKDSQKEAASAESEPTSDSSSENDKESKSGQSQGDSEARVRAAQSARESAEEAKAQAEESLMQVENELAQAQNDLKKTQGDLQNEQSTREQIEAELEQVTSDLNELIVAYSESENMIAIANSVIAQYEQEHDLDIDSLVESLVQERLKQGDVDVPEELATALGDLEEATKAKEQAEEELAKAQEQIASLQNAKEAAENELQEFEQQYYDDVDDRVAGHNAQDQLEAMEEELAKAKAETEEAKAAKTKAEKELSDYKKKFDASYDPVTSKASQSNASEETMTKLQEENAQLKTERDQLKQEKEALEQQTSSQASLPSFMGIPVRASLNDYSWEEIAQIAHAIENNAYSYDTAKIIAMVFNLVDADGKLTGDTKTVTLSNDHSFDVFIVGLFQDYGEDYKPAAFTFMLSENFGDRGMNDSDTNSGGWEGSTMRHWLNYDVFDMLPETLQDSIKPVTKYTNNTGKTTDWRSVTQTKEWLFLFSWAECLGPISWNEGTDQSYIDEVDNMEGSQYAWFSEQGVKGEQDHAALVRTNQGESDEVVWWMRSSAPNTDTSFGDMGPAVDNGGLASTKEGVVFGFCL